MGTEVDMDEVVPGILHWSARHPRTGGTAHSYLLVDAATVLDPMAPPEAIELLRQHPPKQVVLTNRHHYREAAALVDEFGVAVLCPRPGLHEFEGDERQVEPYGYGDELAPGLIAHEVGAICPDDAAIEVTAGAGFLAFADGLVHRDGELGFVSDGLLGDDPEAVKSGLVRSLAALCERPFDGLLFAHGEPIASGGKQALTEFVAARSQRSG
jgi:hypothetical protein